MSTNPIPSLPRLTPEENINPPRKIGCLTYCVVGVIVLIVLVWFNIFRHGPPLRIAKETTYITEPLTPDGLDVDYFAALEQRVYPPEMQTDDNGYRVVFRTLGDFSNRTRDFDQMQQRYEKLGLDALRDKPTLTYIEPEEFFKNRYISHPEEFEDVIAAEKEKASVEVEEDGEDEDNIWFPGPSEFSFDPYDYWQSLTKTPEKLRQNPVVQKWLEQNNAALDLVAEQVKKSAFVTPYLMTSDSFAVIGMSLPDAQGMRAFARGLDTRACIRIGEGDFEGAIDDILACYRLGRHEEKQAFLVEALIGISMEGIAHAMPYHNNPEARANTEQLKRLQEGLAALSPHKGLVHKLETERLMCLDSMLSVMKGAPLSGVAGGHGSGAVETAMALVGLDWNVVFKKVNAFYDGIIAKTYTYTSPSTNPARLLTLKSRSEAVADIFIALFIPAVGTANEAYRRNDCDMNLKRIVLAMHLYEREHGTLPPAFCVDADGKPLHS
ncbi:MAG: DUF1559 domain-containing protein, partial [Planctomycetaceae bacterium]|nr:DUF1559 domain-containing protein [Planctomycetaceae bacterium]